MEQKPNVKKIFSVAFYFPNQISTYCLSYPRAHSLENLIEGHKPVFRNSSETHCLIFISFGESRFKPPTTWNQLLVTTVFSFSFFCASLQDVVASSAIITSTWNMLLYIFKNDSILKKVRLLEPDKRSEYINMQINRKIVLNYTWWFLLTFRLKIYFVTWIKGCGSMPTYLLLSLYLPPSLEEPVPSNPHISTPFFQWTVFFFKICFGSPPQNLWRYV